MNPTVPNGSYKLQPGVELLPAAGGGVVLQQKPLRAIGVSAAAFSMLQRAREGFAAPPTCDREATDTDGNLLAFIDTLCQADILQWSPPTEPFEPFVSIIVPVYNRADEIGGCLASLLALDYPSDKREIIVVDDASGDHSAAVVRRFPVRLIVMPHNGGQSAARNAAARVAKGDVLAFIDSDCRAGTGWLRQLLPYFHDPRVSVVGGKVAAWDCGSLLDRYETTHSALNMGTKMRSGATPYSDFYVPTCNMLIRKDAYHAVGGLDEKLRVGEDVDLCWKIKARGFRGLYAPIGRVVHKHRSRLWDNLKRRYEYGTSEAMLYARYETVSKRFPWQTIGLLMLLAILSGLWTRSWLAAVPALLLPAMEAIHKKHRLAQKLGIHLSLPVVIKAVLKSHFSLAYFLTYYAVRYYLSIIILLTVFWPGLWPLALFLTLFPAVVEFFRKQSPLFLPLFLAFFWLEQLFYQAGAFRGCLSQGSFRLYRIGFVPSGFLPYRRGGWKKRLRLLLGAIRPASA